MDDSDFIEESLKPTRKQKCKSETEIAQPKPLIQSDYLLPNSDTERCFVCDKDLKHLDELRRSLHVNDCLDQQEAKTKYEEKNGKWKQTVDCPICGEPLHPGPFRAAHAKRCGKKHNVNAKSLLSLMDTQTKIAEVKKQNGIIHTKLKEPKLEMKKRSSRFKDEPRSLFDEEMKLAKALSVSMNSNESEHIETKRPSKLRLQKQRPRSFSFVELEPYVCKCAVIERVQENFLKIFKTHHHEQNLRALMRDNNEQTEKLIKDTGVCLRKLSRLEQLADDLNNYAESYSDVTIFSRENATISACRFVIAARAPALLRVCLNLNYSEMNEVGLLSMREYSEAAIRSYIRYLTSASIIWNEDERGEVFSIAMKYGPAALAKLCEPISHSEANSTRRVSDKNPGVDLRKNSASSGKVSCEVNLGETEVEKSGTSIKVEVESVDTKENQESYSSRLEKIFIEEKDERVESEIGESSKDVNTMEDKEQINASNNSSVIFIDAKYPQEIDVAGHIDESTMVVERMWKSVSEILGNRSGKIVDSPNIPFHTSSRSEILEANEENRFSKEISSILIDTANSHFAVEEPIDALKLYRRDKPDSDASHHSSSPPFCSVPDLDNVHHVKDSFEKLLKDLSPIKPVSLYNKAISSPVACCSKQLITGNLSPNMSSNILLLSPNSPYSNIEHGYKSERSLNKTKSSPALSFKLNSNECSPPLALFDEISVSHKSAANSPVRKKTRVETILRQTSTPLASDCRLARRLEELGSNVKVLKTNDITPMPNYDQMNEKELKAELAKFGVRPMGKKRGIAVLKRIYEETHPVLECTPVAVRSKAAVNLVKRFEENCDEEINITEDCDTDKTLNRSLDEMDIMEESCLDNNEPMFLPKDLDGMQSALLQWLRKEENSNLHNKLLGLNVISFEEFADRLSRADSAVSQIPKKALIEILDRLHVTFKMPADGWERKRKRAKK